MAQGPTWSAARRADFESKRPSLADKLMSFVEFDTNGGCWLWSAGVSEKGYGRLRVGRRNTGAHRVSWEVFHGRPPGDLWVLHKCDVPACVNPGHLFLGTAGDNNRDCKAKGRRRDRQGSRHHWAAMDEDLAATILKRLCAGESRAAVARALGVSPAAVIKVGASWTWKHVPGPRPALETGLRGVAAANSAKTHCDNGHPFTPGNTAFRPNGHRLCRVCARASARAWKARRRRAGA